ncbi:MAG: hypothetical protein HQ523_01475 [Lentisphaerae bacterium]|nr:hypothetical protein [Lentisphaerota bacterium]
MELEKRARTLSTLYYVLGGLALVTGVAVPALIVIVLRENQMLTPTRCIVAVGVWGLDWAVAALYLSAARAIAGRRWWRFCIAAAAFSCIDFPLGTALGIATLLHLTRPAVREEFASLQNGRVADCPGHPQKANVEPQ